MLSLKIDCRFCVSRINSGAGIHSMMSAFASFARESSTDVRSKSAAFRHRGSRLVERFRKRTSKAFGVERRRAIPKTRTPVIETLDRAGAAAPSDEALMNDISRRRHDALAEL